MTSRAILEDVFRTAVAAVHPASCLARHLPPAPAGGKLIVLAAGKAAGAMAEVTEQHYLAQGFPAARMTGIAVTRRGYSRPTRRISVVEAGHPIPDDAGLVAAERTLHLAQTAQAEDLVLALISGGASANWTAPVSGVTLADKQTVTRLLLRCGASIGEINTVRKHLSRLKGGRLATYATPAQIVTLAISDVAGDDPAVIGSGPTVPDPTTLADARAIVARYALELPPTVAQALANPVNESPKPGNPAFVGAQIALIARPSDAFNEASVRAKALGYDCVFLGERIEGEASAVAADHARLAREFKTKGRRVMVLSGGELTVTIRGNGRGGPNQEYALALACALDGARGIAALAADTDGTDGGTGRADDPAGAYIDASTVARARAAGLDPAVFLLNNDSTTFFARLGDLVTSGPTFTNVNDFRAILVDDD